LSISYSYQALACYNNAYVFRYKLLKPIFYRLLGRDWPEELSWYINLLQAGRSGYRIPVGWRISVPVQTGPGAHSASYTVGTWFFPGVKRPERGVNHPPPFSADVKERVELYVSYTFGPS